VGASPVHSQRRLIVAPAEPAAADKTCIALSFNGRTSDSDSLDRGSNPWGATNEILCSGIRLRFSQPGVLPTRRHILVVAAKLDMRAVAVAEF
jgi:hypothetical protein